MKHITDFSVAPLIRHALAMHAAGTRRIDTSKPSEIAAVTSRFGITPTGAAKISQLLNLWEFNRKFPVGSVPVDF